MFYVKTTLNKIPKEFPTFFKALLTVTITSKFLVIDSTSTFLLDLQGSSLLHIEDTSAIIPIWNQLHTNFKGSFVSVPKLRTSYEYFGIIYGKAVVCDLGHKYSSSGLYCLIHIISTILNFTAYDDVFQRAEVPINTLPIATVRKDGHQVLLGFLNNPNNRLQVQSHFYNVLPFGFILVIDKTEFEIANPILSFDVLTWVLILATIVLISSYIWVENGTGFSTLNCKDLPLLTVSSTLTEQSLSVHLWKKSQSSFKISKYLLLIWFILSIVLIGGFRSAFYRFLTSSVLPTDVPSTLEELMESKYAMVGSDSFLVSKGSGPAINILKYVLDSYLASSEDEEENEDDNEDKHIVQDQTVSKISKREAQRKATFAQGLQKLVFINKIAYSKLRVLHNYSLPVPSCCTNKPVIILAKSFAMVSSTEGTRISKIK
ncbi:hypothetical protein Fcan01_17110 [Folsomia candida]|uniref:Uncharacterized protein n=1 Tax=Folsomia candida TaxID=158441 RepID=A0A226DT96_FOLCA|nr:hypothetical protein Fcan01_17110 [Folsomia candida]